jgi:uncharacterized membrane-anchored protein
LLHLGFLTNEEEARINRRNLHQLCTTHGVTAPTASDKHFVASFDGMTLRWEQHSEFTTYTWEIPSSATGEVFTPAAAALEARLRVVPPPGQLLVAVDLHAIKYEDVPVVVEKLFDRTSLAAAENTDRTACYATDFRPDASGFVRIALIDRCLDDDRAGALIQRLLEIETYRTLTLLGLPEAQRVLPSIGATERRLAEVTKEMRKTNDLASNRQLLDELTTLAAELEAGAAASVFRFGATRAYNEIVQQRLEAVGEHKIAGIPTWSSFLARRMNPAVRTCLATELRQTTLSLKLSRAADLLRTRVDVELEKQNQDLLKSMNARTRMQLRLQTTVEGLSVAAITYYLVSLFGYLAKAAHEGGYLHVEPAYAIAAFIPIASLTIWLMVRRIRKRHVLDEL